LIAVLTAACLFGCGGDAFIAIPHKAEYLAHQAGWTYGPVEAAPFTLAAAVSPATAKGATLTVYLEGDGLAFLGPRTVSADPTPTDPLALRLALAHPGGPVAYLARPCQYGMAPPCHPAYWTSHRYAPEVVAGMDKAIDRIKARVGAERIILVGYSGGGALAVLIAAGRSDVSGLVTVAANLDTALWVRLQGLTPLSGSLDPAGAAGAVAALAQVHLVGGRDDVIPAQVGRAFLGRVEPRGRARLLPVEGFGHVCCWAEEWPRLAAAPALATLPGWLQAP
jgi:pimeloyl-ACP methyl ester carboxylesterase